MKQETAVKSSSYLLDRQAHDDIAYRHLRSMSAPKRDARDAPHRRATERALEGALEAGGLRGYAGGWMNRVSQRTGGSARKEMNRSESKSGAQRITHHTVFIDRTLSWCLSGREVRWRVTEINVRRSWRLRSVTNRVHQIDLASSVRREELRAKSNSPAKKIRVSRQKIGASVERSAERAEIAMSNGRVTEACELLSRTFDQLGKSPVFVGSLRNQQGEWREVEGAAEDKGRGEGLFLDALAAPSPELDDDCKHYCLLLLMLPQTSVG